MGLEFFLGGIINRSFAKIKVNIGKNGLYYQLGRKGALKTWDGIQKKMLQDLIPQVGGEMAEEIVNNAYNIYKKIVQEDSKDQ